MRKLILCFVVLAGCSKQEQGGAKKFLLPWMDASGNYQLQVVTLSTLDSPLEMKGTAAEIYFQSGFSNNGYAGHVARPHLTRSGDVYIPQDSESSLALGVYAQMERLLQFEQKQGTAAQISWPRKVGVELNVIGPDGSAHDNAHYFSTLDVVGLLPYSQDRHVPISLNHGIVAHEHFHVHFQHEVMNAIVYSLDKTVTLVESLFYPTFSLTGTPSAGSFFQEDTTKPEFLNNIVLRGWNEGLADLFGGIYTQKADFFTASLAQLAVARSLDESSSTLMTGAYLRQLSVLQPKLTSDDFVAIAYGQGTLMARAFYQIAHNGTETPEMFLARLMSRLHYIPPAANPGFKDKVMDYEAILPILLGGFPLSRATCSSLVSVASAKILNRSFSACAKF